MDDLAILGRLIDELPLGIVVLDRAGRVVFYNRYEEALAGRERANVVGRRFFTEIAPCLNVRAFGEDYAERVEAGPIAIRTEFSFDLPIFDRPRDVYLRLSSFDFCANRYGVVLVEDISTQRSIARMNELLSTLLVHDLKNPLSVVRLSLDMLGRSEEVSAAASLREPLERAVRATGRLNRMVSTLLETSHLEATGFRVAAIHVDLRELIERIVPDMRVLAEARQVRLTADLPAEPVTAVLDVGLLQRAIENLVDNAVRHARRGGFVRVRLSARTDDVTLAVEDDGPGVPEALREKIFERFVQVGARTPEERGYNVGLGLTLVKMVARAHGGFVDVSSGSGQADQGSIFRLVLPRQRPIRTGV